VSQSECIVLMIGLNAVFAAYEIPLASVSMARLFSSEVTVKTHLNNIFHELSARDRVGLIRYAIRVGLAGLHERES
jgi:hypothetical protein